MGKKKYSVPNDELSDHARGQQVIEDLVLLLEGFVLNPILQKLYDTHLQLYYTRYCPFAGNKWEAQDDSADIFCKGSEKVFKNTPDRL